MFYSTCLFLLYFLGGSLQRALGLAGTLAVQLAFFLGLAAYFAVVLDRRPLREVFRLRLLTVGGVVKSLVLGVAAWAMVQLLGFLVLYLVERAGGKMPQLYSYAPFGIALFIRALLPAICEESAFRGYVLYNLRPLGDKTAIILTGLLFGAMHGSLIRLVPLALLGMVFATAVQRSGSILPGMIMHFTNNVIVLALSAFYKPAATAAPPNLWLLVASVLVLGWLVWGMAGTFGPQDVVAQSPAPEPAPAVADEPQQRVPLAPILLPLIPAVLIYSYVVTYEVMAVFAKH